MAKTNRKPVDRLERQQRLAQRRTHDDHDFDYRSRMSLNDRVEDDDQDTDVDLDR